jgi:hypothetical protein
MVEAEMQAKAQKQILGNITRFVLHRMKQLVQEISPDKTPGRTAVRALITCLKRH